MNRTIRLALLAALSLAAACGDDDDDDGAPDAGDPVPDAGEDAGGDSGIQTGTTIETAEGPVAGSLDGSTRVFLGIPYAAPPVGDLRFRPPAPVEPWTETLEATEVGPPCAQYNLAGTALVEGSSEDCLTLNVWTPAEIEAPVPVMVWIHGGGFVSGSGGEPIYEGVRLSAAGSVVVVTLNYRLGPLGFLALPALDAEDAAHPTSGTYGFEDQRAALEWVQRNAAAFGGDPDDVTIFGESAGAISVCLHLASPDAEHGLFHRALMESGSCAVPLQTREEAHEIGDSLITAIGCDGQPEVLPCLRDASAEDVLGALGSSISLLSPDSVRWAPVAEGVTFPVPPDERVAAGDLEPVPVLLGTNADEGTLFARLGYGGIDEAGYEDVVTQVAGENAAAILAEYPASAFDSPEVALAEVIAHALFVCPTRRVARSAAGAGQPAFLYSFDHAIAFPLLPGIGAFHGSELGFVFGASSGGFSLEPEEEPLSAEIMGYWTRFAATGDPNGDCAFEWPAYDAASSPYLVLDLTIASGEDLQGARCDFWDSLDL